MRALFIAATIGLYSWLPACVAPSRAAERAADYEPKLDLHAIVFLKKGVGASAFERAKWSHSPNDALVASAFPPGERKSGYADFDCRLAADRSLAECSINALEPNNELFRNAFLQLIREYRLSGPPPEPDEVSHVNMMMRLHRGFAPSEPCGPFCIPMPAPPPPPPPQEDQPTQLRQ